MTEPSVSTGESGTSKEFGLAVDYILSGVGPSYKTPNEDNPTYHALIAGIPDEAERKAMLSYATQKVFGDGKTTSFFSKKGPTNQASVEEGPLDGTTQG